jgi:D-alanyl-D-alanine carboxypeptidase (penicillin-binding protein 5/6)
MIILAGHLIRTYPEHYAQFGQLEFTFDEVTQRNRNPLLGLGADGLKTGQTSEAGYALVASAERGWAASHPRHERSTLRDRSRERGS